MTYPTARRLAPALAALTLAACQGGVMPPGIEIRAQPALVVPGESTTLSWSGTHLDRLHGERLMERTARCLRHADRHSGRH